jgi:hypothetical protein
MITHLEVALTYIKGRRSLDGDRPVQRAQPSTFRLFLFSTCWKRLDSGYAPSASLHAPELEETDVTNIQI